MIPPLVSFNLPAKPADLEVLPVSFADTTITIKPVSAAGRQFFADRFGAGAASVDLRRSGLFAFCEQAQLAGLTVIGAA